MNFKSWLLSEEIFPNKTATVYHRTQNEANIYKILSSGFKVGEGCAYGCGLYTTFAIESQFNNYMVGYGEFLIKFKATDLDKYLIFQLSTAKYILGNDYKISSQFKKFNIQADPDQLKEFDYKQEHLYFSSDLAVDVYSDYHEITSKCKGIIFRGQKDGYVLLKYEPVNDSTITMLGYAHAPAHDASEMRILQNNNKKWITQTTQSKISQIEKLPEKRKEEFVQLSKKPNELIQELMAKNEISKIISILKNNHYFELNLKKSNLSQDKINQLAKLVLKYKEDLSSEDLVEVLACVSNPSTISDNINKLVDYFDLSNYEIYSMLNYSKHKKEIANMIGEEKIKNLSSYHVYNLIKYAANINEIKTFVDIFGEENINFEGKDVTTIIKSYDDNLFDIMYILRNSIEHLDYLNVMDLIHRTKHPKEMIDSFLKYRKNLTGEIVFTMIRYYPDPYEIINILGKEMLEKMHGGLIGNLIGTAADPIKMANYLKDYLYKISLGEISDIFYNRRLDPKIEDELKNIIMKYNKDYHGY